MARATSRFSRRCWPWPSRAAARLWKWALSIAHAVRGGQRRVLCAMAGHFCASCGGHVASPGAEKAGVGRYKLDVVAGAVRRLVGLPVFKTGGTRWGSVGSIPMCSRQSPRVSQWRLRPVLKCRVSVERKHAGMRSILDQRCFRPRTPVRGFKRRELDLTPDPCPFRQSHPPRIADL